MSDKNDLMPIILCSKCDRSTPHLELDDGYMVCEVCKEAIRMDDPCRFCGGSGLSNCGGLE